MPQYEKRTPREKLYVRLDPTVIAIIKEGARSSGVSITAYIENAITVFNDIRISEIKPIERGRYKKRS